VLAAATALADTAGLNEVTMRRVAADLGVEAMSLYHHVAGKDDLLDGLVESLMSEIAADIPAPRADGPEQDWRTDVRERCLAARRVMLRHPWAPTLISTRTSVPRALYLHYEALLAAMIDGGLSYALGHRALHALGSMALGFDRGLFSPAAAGELDGDVAEEEFVLLAAQLPYLSAMAASEIHDAADPTLDWCDSQAEFEFTLRLLLDGLQRAHETEQSTGSAPRRG
jgi:AcrR family transcriptional regulator